MEIIRIINTVEPLYNGHRGDRRKWPLCRRFKQESIGNLSKDVFERRTSTGSEAFFLFICLDAIKFSSLTFFSLLKTIYPRVLTKPLPNDAKSPVPVDVRRSKTLLLKFSNVSIFVRRDEKSGRCREVVSRGSTVITDFPLGIHRA